MLHGDAVAELLGQLDRLLGQGSGAGDLGDDLGGVVDGLDLVDAVDRFDFYDQLHCHSPGQFTGVSNCLTTMRLSQHSIGVVKRQRTYFLS